MRAAFVCAFALFSPVIAAGEPITITAASATYWTATDTVEINVWYDRPIVVPGTFVGVGGTRTDESTGLIETFGVANSQSTRDEVFEIRQRVYDSHGATVSQRTIREFDMPLSGGHFGVEIPFADTGLSEPTFLLGAIVHSNFDPLDVGSLGFDVYSTVDERVIVTPEPTSGTLASLGFVLSGIHLVRRPRLRLGRSKRHVCREPADEAVSPV